MQYLIHQSLERVVTTHPNNQAFVFNNESLTFAELHKKTNQLAHFLIDKGVQKGDRIGIMMNRSVETAIAVYGILKAGAVFVPIDPFSPAVRVQFLIEDCGIAIIVSNALLGKKWHNVLEEKTGLRLLIGFEDELPVSTYNWSELDNWPESTPEIDVMEQDLAYIIYTSGSTGMPKGIMHTHRSGLAYARLSADLYQLDERDRIANHSPLHFDISTMGYLTAPFVGATTVIVSDAYTKMPASLVDLIEREKLTVWYSVPLAIIQMLQSGMMAKKDLSSLRWVLYGGEPFPYKTLKSIMLHLPKCIFSNVYGPAEVNQCTFYNFREIPESDDPIPLGVIWNNTQGLVVDEKDKQVKPTEVGELLIRSATMMAGYWNQPELTERSLYKRKGNSGLEEVFYRTGDLVKVLTDGQLTFYGRKDQQVKIRGYRVELEEVTDQILKHEAVKTAAVIADRMINDNLRILAYIVLNEGHEIEEKQLLRYMKKVLPAYAVPQALSFQNELPRTSAGKIDFKVLRETAKMHFS